MPMLTRRTTLGAGLSAGSGFWPARALSHGDHAPARYRAMAFDALAIFDSSPVAGHAEHYFPGKGAELMNLWRTRQFEYAWLHTLSGRYRDFMSVTEDALVFAAAATGLALSSQQRDEFLQLFLRLQAWPDAATVLRDLANSGVQLALLSNFTRAMLEGAIASSGLDNVFAHALSTDLARAYKPDPRAYRLGVEALRLPREEILFVAFAGWDAAGAKTFGYPTFWVNRLNLPPERLGAEADGMGRTFTDLAAFA